MEYRWSTDSLPHEICDVLSLGVSCPLLLPVNLARRNISELERRNGLNLAPCLEVALVALAPPLLHCLVSRSKLCRKSGGQRGLSKGSQRHGRKEFRSVERLQTSNRSRSALRRRGVAMKRERASLWVGVGDEAQGYPESHVPLRTLIVAYVQERLKLDSPLVVHHSTDCTRP